MKRDWELIRLILVEVERGDKSEYPPAHFHNCRENEISYHIKMLMSAGYVEGWSVINKSYESYIATSLTFSGHEFLDKIRDDNVWNRTKELLKNKGIELGFESIKHAAPAALALLFNS